MKCWNLFQRHVYTLTHAMDRNDYNTLFDHNEDIRLNKGKCLSWLSLYSFVKD